MSRQIKKFVKNLTDYNLPDVDSLERKVNTISGNVDFIADTLNHLEVPDKVSELENDSGFIKHSELYTLPSEVWKNQDNVQLFRGNFYANEVQEYGNVVAVIDLTKVTSNKLIIKNLGIDTQPVPNLGIKLTSSYFNDVFWNQLEERTYGENIYPYIYNALGDRYYDLQLDYTVYGQGEYAIDLSNYPTAKALFLIFWDYAMFPDESAYFIVKNSGFEIWQGTDGILTPIINDVKEINDRVDELQLYKFPNATIFGQPTIQNGQVSNFSNNNYLQFPFLVDFQNQPFQIDFSFTTGDDISGQQNILDSNFGLAFAIRNGKVVAVASNNGTSWTTGELISNQTLTPNTTYYFRIHWVRGTENPFLSIVGGLSKDDTTISVGIITEPPYPKTMYIGRSYVNNGNYFKGSINLNNASLTIANKVVWTGMDDVGLATRAAVDLSNLDAKGNEVIDNRIDNKIVTKQDTLISGTNIKTINNQSILGEGNITIQGGGGSTNIINLTQAEYDALEEKDPETIYNITDATDIDTYTKAEIDNKIGNIETLLSQI